jgi:predicted deacylase
VRLLFIGGLHTGREDNTRRLAGEILSYFLGKPNELPDNITLYILPNANPDGHANNTHNNSEGVDLNRNWPTYDWRPDPYHPSYGRILGAGGTAPLSEPETKSLYNFILEKRPAIIFTWHSRAGTVESNDIGFANDAADIYAISSGYNSISQWPYYEVTGSFTDAMEKLGIPAVDIELATYKSTEFKRNLKGVKAVVEYASRELRQ